ncbi:MAG TPA: hypothetical protein VJZ16_02890, partial [Syntrophales bacterium]|nr:hypothetical protein [Syntrophales bacterium]
FSLKLTIIGNSAKNALSFRENITIIKNNIKQLFPSGELGILSFRGAYATRNLYDFRYFKISPFGRNDIIDSFSKLPSGMLWNSI